MRKITDFTEGSILQHILLFSWPMFLGNLLQAFYNTVDSIWVGRFLGPQALAAVSVGFPIVFALIALVTGVTMASTTLVAQYFGAQRPEQVQRTINNSLLLLMLLGLVMTGVGTLGSTPLLRLINVPADIFPQARAYLRLFSAGLLATFLYNAVGAILRGLGDSRTPLRFLVHATVINIVLDPLFILGPGPFPRLGVTGAALATVLAQLYAALISLRYLRRQARLWRLTKDFWRLDWHLTALTFKIGLPAGLQQILVSLSALAVSAIVNTFGSKVVAGFGVGTRLDQFAFMPAMSIGLAVSAIVGQNLGAGAYRRVGETVKWSTILGAGLTGAVSLLVLSFPAVFLRLFTNDLGVIAAGAGYLRYMAWAYVPFALMFTLAGVLRGAGDTIPTMFFSLASLWLVRVPLARYLSRLPHFGVRGVWLAIMLSPMLGLLLYFLYYRSGLWRKRAIVKPRCQPVPEAAGEKPILFDGMP